MKIIKTLTVEIPNEFIPYWQGYLDGYDDCSANSNTPNDVKSFFERQIENDNITDWNSFDYIFISEELKEEG